MAYDTKGTPIVEGLGKKVERAAAPAPAPAVSQDTAAPAPAVVIAPGKTNSGGGFKPNRSFDPTFPVDISHPFDCE